MISPAERVLALELLQREVTHALEVAKASARGMLDPGDRQTAALTHAGRRYRLGSVTLTDPKPRALIVDRGAFVAYVADRLPDEVEAVTEVRVRPATEKALLADPIDPETGEMLPGVDLIAGSPVLQVRPEKDGAAVLAEFLAASATSLDALLAAASAKEVLP